MEKDSSLLDIEFSRLRESMLLPYRDFIMYFDEAIKLGQEKYRYLMDFYSIPKLYVPSNLNNPILELDSCGIPYTIDYLNSVN